jgi:hypothetical protein
MDSADPPVADLPTDPSDGSRRSNRFWLVIGVVLFACAGLVAALLIGDDSDDEAGSGTGTTTTAPPDTTTTTSTTAAPVSTMVAPVDTSTAVWPVEGSGISYTDPVAAAHGFAEDLVGFVDPVVGEFQQGDAHSGEVEVRPRADGPVTTVFVRQLSSDDDWWVLGSATANIEVTAPAASDEITSPVRLQGTSTAFEATVGVVLYEDGSSTPLGTGYVMGGSMGELSPFDSELAFDEPGAAYGALVFTTVSMEDGSVWEASVVRVGFPS